MKKGECGDWEEVRGDEKRWKGSSGLGGNGGGGAKRRREDRK